MKEKNEARACALKTSIGGQALIEGIMMRGPKKTVMAVRNTKGEIVVEDVETSTKPRPKICPLNSRIMVTRIYKIKSINISVRIIRALCFEHKCRIVSV